MVYFCDSVNIFPDFIVVVLVTDFTIVVVVVKNLQNLMLKLNKDDTHWNDFCSIFIN